MPTQQPPGHRVVILGAGFGGLYTAVELERLQRQQHARNRLQVTLISRDNYFTMTPLLFEAGSGVLEPRHAVSPVRRLLRNARFVEAEVEAVDLPRRVVIARHVPGMPPYEIGYDQLVVAVGGVTETRKIPGAQTALTFKSLADAIYLRNHVIDAFERADVEPDPHRQRALVTFVVIGGGLVGVELVGELTDFVERLCKPYTNVRCGHGQVCLIESGPRIAHDLPEDLSDYAAGSLARRGVRVLTNTRVSAIEPDRVVLADGEIRARTIVLTAGLAANPLLEKIAVAKDPRGRILAGAQLRSTSHPDVWALGDCAIVPDPQGKPYPHLAQHALRQARVLANNIIAVQEQRPLKPFVYSMVGTLASLGHYRGVGRIHRFKVRGFLAWWIWRTYYLFQMPRWARRMRIMFDWTVALFFKPDIVKLDLFGEVHPTGRVVPQRLADGRHYPGHMAEKTSVTAHPPSTMPSRH